MHYTFRVLNVLMLMSLVNGAALQKIDDRIECRILNVSHTICDIPPAILKTIKTNEFELTNVYKTPVFKLGSLHRKQQWANRIEDDREYHKVPITVDTTQTCLINEEEKIICHKSRRKNHKDVPYHK